MNMKKITYTVTLRNAGKSNSVALVFSVKTKDILRSMVNKNWNDFMLLKTGVNFDLGNDFEVMDNCLAVGRRNAFGKLEAQLFVEWRVSSIQLEGKLAKF